MQESLSLEQSLLAELQKDVKLKGGQIATDENGNPLKAFDAIAKSIMNNAMKGDIAAVNFIRNITKQSNPEADEQRRAAAEQALAEQTARLQHELENEGLWIGQQIEIEQLAQNWLIIESLNTQMQAADYTDIIQEMKKDGSVSIRINPLHEWRDRYQKQFLNDWKELRLDAQRRRIMMEQNKKRK